MVPAATAAPTAVPSDKSENIEEVSAKPGEEDAGLIKITLQRAGCPPGKKRKVASKPTLKKPPPLQVITHEITQVEQKGLKVITIGRDRIAFTRRCLIPGVVPYFLFSLFVF